ncbi:MAG: glycosyltransferase, partial [Chitinophagales bacterium]
KMYTVGPCIANLFQNEYRKNCEVICNFPRSFQRLPTTKSEKFTIIYQGDLNEGRGVDVMIKAMMEMPEALFWVVGDGFERLKLEELVKSSNLSDRVTFYGYIAPSEINNLTSKAHLGVNLLENIGLNHYYSLANKFFDYIQNGIPVLTMDFPEYRIINEKYQIAVLVKEMGSKEILSAVKSLMQNQDFYDNLVKNTDLASRFLTWETQEKKLCSIYNDVK